MARRKSLGAVVLLLAALPLLGAPCTDQKVVDVVLGFSSTIEAVATGATNTYSDTGTFDLKSDLDLRQELADAGVNTAALSPDAVRIVQILYRVTQPDAVSDRRITNGRLVLSRLDESTGQALKGAEDLVLATGWSMPAGTGNVVSTTDWTDITGDLSAAGVDLLDQYLADCIAEIRDGTPFHDPVIQWDVSGESAPTDRPTGFVYEIRILFQGAFMQEYEVPFG